MSILRLSLLAFALGTWTPALAIDRFQGVVLRVELRDGKTYEGRGRILVAKEAVEVETRDGKKTFPLARVARLDEVDPLPRPEEDVAKDRRELEARIAAIDSANAGAWARLGQWALRRGGLEHEAREAFARAVEIDPELAPARSGLGQVKDLGSWVDAREALRAKLAAAKDDQAVMKAASFGAGAGLREEAISALLPLVDKDPFQKDLLRVLRPIVAGRRALPGLRLPVRGAWRVCEDPTRHHEQKAYALYAVDMVREDEEGRTRRGPSNRPEEALGWDEPVLAAADGTVLAVNDGFEDLPIGRIGDFDRCNGVLIRHGGGESTEYIHLRKGSVRKKVGDTVKAGDVIGNVGNSGATGFPHLHFTVILHARIAVPWRCEGYRIVLKDGQRVFVERGRPTEGQKVEAD